MKTETLQSTRRIFQVSELTALIKENLETHFENVWIEGEVSNFTQPMSGHCYLTLKDKDAQIRVVIFKYVHQYVRFRIENGLKILCFGKLSVYAPRGEYQLVANAVEPKGFGALQLAFEQLKKKLQAEGLFDASRKKELPLFPRCIGIVTSATGAAIRDILHILDRRFSNLTVLLIPVKVQGEGAAEEIARAIELFNEYAKVDVLIVGRGGGSLEDLWAFNEEKVARAIAASKIPIISAVGHEIDFTISDFVADLRAPTPSAAAELVIATKLDFENKILQLEEKLRRQISYLVERYQTRLLAAQQSYFFRQPKSVLEKYLQRLDTALLSLRHSLEQSYQQATNRFSAACRQLEILNPLAVLARGFGISFNAEGQLVRSINSVAVQEEITTRFSDGKIVSRIIKKERINENGQR